MDEILKRSHIFILIAILVGIIAFVSRPSYAGGAFSEVPSATKSTKYSASARKAVVTIRWSKAYSRRDNGAVTNVSGYEIQYAKNANYKGAKKVRKGSKVRKAVIKLKGLNSKKKYNKKIGLYHFRVRSYVTIGGKKVYSKWTEASKVQKVTVYSAVTPKSINAERNTVTARWAKEKSADGYIVFGKKAASNDWKKKCVVDDPDLTEFTDDGLAYSCEYTYSVVAYRKKLVRDPRKLNTSYLKLLDNASNVNRIKTEAFSIAPPVVKAYFSKDILKVKWEAVTGAENYFVEVSKSKDFNDDTIQKYDLLKDDLMGNMNTYTMEIDDVEPHSDYYVRVRATGKHKGEDYDSGYSEVKFAEYGAGTYTIQFDGNYANGGKMKPCIVSEGEDFKLPANQYVRDGYVFVGWCLEPSNKVTVDPMTIGQPKYGDQTEVLDLADPDETVRLYACWQGVGPEAAAEWAEIIANDDNFYYGNKVESHCWFCQGGDQTFICNSFVAAAYTHGMPYFKGYWGGSTNHSKWLKKGFSDVGENVPVSKIRKGDVITCWNGSRWGHIMIAVTDGNDPDARVAHAARKGEDPDSIRIDPMKKRLGKYSKYHVIRLEPAA